jgi:hypothetical protein
MVRMMQGETDMLLDDVIKLHDIARKIEQEIGVGQLSDDIRKAADRLNELLKRV